MRNRTNRPLRPLWAGAAYFVLVFACGFALGTVRVLLVAPAVGELAAVLLEAPVILAIAWLASGWLVKRMAPPPGPGERLLTGVIAFACLMGAELALTVLAFGGRATDMVAGWATPAGAVGLASQIAFAFFPLAQRPPTGANA